MMIEEEQRQQDSQVQL